MNFDVVNHPSIIIIVIIIITPTVTPPLAAAVAAAKVAKLASIAPPIDHIVCHLSQFCAVHKLILTNYWRDYRTVHRVIHFNTAPTSVLFLYHKKVIIQDSLNPSGSISQTTFTNPQK